MSNQVLAFYNFFKPTPQTPDRLGVTPHLFAPQWVGLLIIFFMILLGGCNETVDPDEEKRKRYQVDNNISSSKLNPQSGKSTVLSGDQGIAVENDVDSLMARSKMLEMRSQQIDFKEMIGDLTTQQQISERILQLEINKDQRLFAVQNLLVSLLKRIATSDLVAREKLYEILPDYLEDRNPEIQRVAWMAQTTAQLADFLRVEEANSEGFDESIKQLLIRFPTDPLVATELQGIVVQLMIRERRDEAIALMGELSNAYAKSDNANLQELSKILKDRVYLAEIQFDLVAQKMRQGKQQMEVQQQFLGLVEQLATKKDMGNEIYREILWTERWLEEIDNYDAAEQMLLTMEINIANHQDAAFRDKVTADIGKAKNRLALVGKPLVLTGQDRAGKPLSTEAQKGKTTLVIFWSASVPSSVKVMQQLVQIYRRYHSRGLEIVSFCVDKNASQALSIIGNQSPPWLSMYRSQAPSSQQGMDTAGVQQLPYLILLNKEGIVIDVNLSIPKLPNEIEESLGP